MIVHVYTLLSLVTHYQTHVNYIIYAVVTVFHLVTCGTNYIYHFVVLAGASELAEIINAYSMTGEVIFFTVTLIIGALTPIAVTGKIMLTTKKMKAKTWKESLGLIFKDKFIVMTLVAQLVIVIGYFVLGYIQAYTLIMGSDADTYAIYSLNTLLYCLHSSLSTLSFQHFSRTLQNIKGGGGSYQKKNIKKASADGPATAAQSTVPILD